MNKLSSLKPVKIGNKTLGKNHKCYIVAEIGSNFDGSLLQAKKLIRLAKNCGADAAKFQSFKTENLLSRKGFEKRQGYQTRWKKSVWDVYKSAELPREWHKELNQYARKIGIHFFTSAWDFEAVDLLENINAPAIKIGSGDLTYHKLLEYAASTKKPILLATGISTMKEIEEAVKVIRSVGNNQIILLHSVVQYPSPIEFANLKVLETLREKFKLNVGYSDHSLGSLVALASVVLGACIIEKHFTIDPTLSGPDHPHAMDPKSFKEMVQSIRLLEKAIGDGIKKIEPIEQETRIIMRRGIWTTRKISKGEKFTKGNVMALRPAIGISASEYDFVIGKVARRSYQPFEALRKNDF
ncbi:MAG: N-acetylneuraminate synthase family protein [Thaumarchaeota archaeon]|nr:N-acetylneuraminate synthase family protein [Nitrososphaerota archaeon]